VWAEPSQSHEDKSPHGPGTRTAGRGYFKPKEWQHRGFMPAMHTPKFPRFRSQAFSPATATPRKRAFAANRPLTPAEKRAEDCRQRLLRSNQFNERGAAVAKSFRAAWWAAGKSHCACGRKARGVPNTPLEQSDHPDRGPRLGRLRRVSPERRLALSGDAKRLSTTIGRTTHSSGAV
jgi:hypothetical protein